MRNLEVEKKKINTTKESLCSKGGFLYDGKTAVFLFI